MSSLPQRYRLAVPLLAVLGLGGFLLVGTAQQAQSASHAVALTQLATSAGDLAFALELERASAAVALLTGADKPARDAFAVRTTITDTAVTSFRTAREAVRGTENEAAAILARVDRGVQELAGLRTFVGATTATTWSAAVLRYRLLIADLLALRDIPATAGLPAALADQVRAASALSQAVEFVGLEHAAVVRATDADQLTPAGLQSIVAARTGFEDTRQRFTALAQPQWQAWWDTGVAGPPVVAAAQMEGVVAQTRLDDRVPLDPNDWTSAMVAEMTLMHTVQSKVDKSVLDSVQLERDSQARSAIATASVIVLVLVVAVLVAVRVARSMVRRLRALRQGALYVAHRELPEVVARLAEPRGLTAVTPEQVVSRAVIPLRVDGTDEIGEVAEAFVAVSREAVRHAAEQALLRTHVAGMFVAMARRLQQLTDAMMRQLDVLERSETDDARLADLFALDHTGTRIGRYTDSLLVVSGTSSSRRRATPVDLLDVIRAAAGQVEAYQRVQYGVIDQGVAVAPHLVDHTVHALAELIDNACAFSPPEYTVVVEGRRIGPDTLVEITDRGIGLAPGALNELNARLSAAPTMDARSLRSIGIATVAAIAAWHGLRVSLSPSEDGGTTARMIMPPEATIRAPRHLHPTDAPPPLWPMVPRLLERPGTVVAGVTWPRRPEALAAAVTGGRPGARPAGPDGPASGWRAAAEAATATASSTSDAGLPMRDPMARLVPGSIPSPRAPVSGLPYVGSAAHGSAAAWGSPPTTHHGPDWNAPTDGTVGHSQVGGTGNGSAVRRDPYAVSAAMRSYQLGLMQGRAGTATTRPTART